MKKVLFILIIAMIFVPVFAQTKEEIKANHEKMLKYNGEYRFLNGKHYGMVDVNFKSEAGKNISWQTHYSIYALKDAIAAYTQNKISSKYIIVTVKKLAEKKFQFTVIMKKTVAGKTMTLKYIIVTEAGNIKVDIDKHISDIRIDYDKIIKCVLQYGPELYDLVKGCFSAPNVENCLLKFLEPASNVYKCVFGKESVPPTRGVGYLNKSWSFSKSNMSKYIEAGNVNVIDHTMQIQSYSSNILYLKVGVTPLAGGVYKAHVVRAQYMGTNFSCRGVLKLVYLK